MIKMANLSDYWITENVQLPRDLMHAMDEDKLVIFVGAGASMSPPTNLPSFENLVTKICNKTGHAEYLTPAFRKLNNKAKALGFDSVLGKIEDAMGKSGNTLHDEIRDILTTSDKPNSTHSALINLANSLKSFRIVTTNQDTILENNELYQNRNMPTVYSSPALPEGDNFTGLVNLHGSIREPDKMIFTDRDFGKAYLTKQFCSRFLTELFSNYTVLFVGYSHDDPLMKYHARGLGECNRYILTDSPDENKWKTLDITPIPYEKGKHSEIAVVLNETAKYYRSNLEDNKIRIMDMAKKDSSFLAKPDISLLREICELSVQNNAKLLSEFLENADNYKWCEFLENDSNLKACGIFQKIFYNGEYGETTKLLSDWFLKVCFLSEDKAANAYGFQKLSNIKWEWNDFFFTKMFEVIANNKVPKSVAQKLSLICASQLNGYQLKDEPKTQTLGELLSRLDIAYYLNGIFSLEEHEELVLAILDKLSTPKIVLQKDINLFDKEQTIDTYSIKSYFPIDSGSNSYNVKEWWNKNKDKLQYYSRILNILNRNLEDYYLKKSNSSDEYTFDRLSYNVNNLFDDTVSKYGKHSIIQIIRDILSSSDNEIKAQFIAQHEHSNLSIFLRLCMFAVFEDKLKTPDTKIKWLIDKNLLILGKNRLHSDHEIYHILSNTLPKISSVTINKLISHISNKSGQEDKDGKFHTYKLFRLCCLLKKIIPNYSSLINPLIAKFKQDDNWNQNDVIPRSRNSSMESIVPEAEPIISAEKFIIDFKNNKIDTLNNLFSTKSEYEKRYGSVKSFDRYDHRSKTIVEAIKIDEEIGFELWDFDYVLTDFKEACIGIKFVILDTFRSDHNVDAYEKLLPRLLDLVENVNLDEYRINEITWYMRDIFDKNKENIPKTLIPRSIKVCSTIWQNQNNSFVAENIFEMSLSSNYWPCSLITVVAAILETNNEDIETRILPESIKNLLNDILSANNLASRFAVAQIFAYLRWFYWCEEDFAIKTLIPILQGKPQKNSINWYAWRGLLWNPDHDNRMLGKGLFAAIFNNIAPKRMDPFDAQEITQLSKMVLSIITFSGIKTSDKRRLQQEIAKNNSFSIKLLHTIENLYSRSESLDFVDIYNKWLGNYISDRLNNRPIALSDQEFNAILALTFLSGNKFPNIAKSIIKSRHKLIIVESQHFHIDDSSIDFLLENCKDILLQLIVFLITNCERKLGWSLDYVIRIIYTKVPESDKKTIDEACKSSGNNFDRKGL
jgi:hypothetical protein